MPTLLSAWNCIPAHKVLVQMLTMCRSGLSSANSSPPQKPLNDWLVNVDDIPLAMLEKDKRPYTIHDDTTDDESDVEQPKPLKRDEENLEEARRLVRTLTNGHNLSVMQDTR